MTGPSAILSLGHLDDEPAGIFRGTRLGDSITARYDGPYGALSCPEDTTTTPLTGGDLTATLTGDSIDGHYTEVYGSGADAVTFRFRFHAGPLVGGH